ncbi:MAG TPA: hypothetical protein VM687_17305 [Stenotrophomonas sp.]|nr:hypothetical protein [Stenotrophomonas sp.]
MPTPLPPAVPRSSFVTVMAWLSLAVAVMSAAGNALQAMAALLAPGLGDLGGMLPAGAPVPPLLAWLGEHLVSLSLLGVVLSLAVAWVSWALLQRREWGRLAFIAVLALAALANFACIPLVDVALAMATAVLDPSGSGDVAAQLVDAGAPMLAALRLVCWLGALAIAVVHGWIIWQLCRPAIRAEFQR